jgi:formate--tetrahydrofolate ligase
MASLSGFSVNDLAVVPVKSPATMTDDDTAESTRRTVTLKKVEIHAGAGLLHVNLTTSLTAAMPKIV